MNSTPKPRRPPERSRSTPRSTPSRRACWQAADGRERSPRSSRQRASKKQSARGPTPRKSAALKHAVALFDAEAAAKKAAKKAQDALDIATLKKYGDLSEADVKELVLDDKWRATIARRVESVNDLIVLDLVPRIEVLGERYGETLSSLETELDELSDRVAGHLVEMGFDEYVRDHLRWESLIEADPEDWDVATISTWRQGYDASRLGPSLSYRDGSATRARSDGSASRISDDQLG